MINANFLIDEFQKLTETDWYPNDDLLRLLIQYINNFKQVDFKDSTARKSILILLINRRLKINRLPYRNFIDQCAKLKIFFNYHQKIEIEESLCDPDVNFNKWVDNKFKNSSVSNISNNIERNIYCIKLDKHLLNDKKKGEVIESLFTSFIYYVINEERTHSYNNSDCSSGYKKTYWDHLKKNHSTQINRNNALTIINASYLINPNTEYSVSTGSLFSLIEETYNDLDNHSYMAIILNDSINEKWKLISDIMLFSEKFNESPLNKIYFRKKSIASTTKKYIPTLDLNSANFEYANEGFTYKDCFVTYTNSQENCILLFEKNKRDEKPIPCPICRTKKIQGNSYPILGVRSWECKNIFCGDKSKYNRGKRYSLSSIIRQQAILDDKNLISPSYLKLGRKDIFTASSEEELYEFIISGYSLHNDNVKTYGISKSNYKLLGRNLVASEKKLNKNKEYYEKFNNLSFFNKFLIKKIAKSIDLVDISENGNLSLYNSEAFETLSSLNSDSIDGAVTSPPYYNAREYSQWENIYCYLYDMFNINSQVFRCLKDGSPYLFNIFDYFDNENTIVFSDMGKKRLILSAYISYIFREIGFKHVGNCVWDKGEIQGNRNSNNGNNSPYYQAPLNCWEHIMIFSKGEPTFPLNIIPKRLQEKPVFKIIKGVNTYGHTAPFPAAIPELLFKILKQGSIILDPFSGSMTTGRTALVNNYDSINIELSKEYCDLSLKMLDILLPQQGDFFETRCK